MQSLICCTSRQLYTAQQAACQGILFESKKRWLETNIITWLSDRMLLTTFHSRTVSKLLPTRNMESRDAKDGRYQRLRRRHVYLHRLAGDDVFATKIESQPKAPFIMVSCQEFEVCCKESKIRIFVSVARISHSTHEGSYVVEMHWRIDGKAYNRDTSGKSLQIFPTPTFALSLIFSTGFITKDSRRQWLKYLLWTQWEYRGSGG